MPGRSRFPLSYSLPGRSCFLTGLFDLPFCCQFFPGLQDLSPQPLLLRKRLLRVLYSESGEQIHLAFRLPRLFRSEHPYDTVFPVISGNFLHLAGPEPPDALCHPQSRHPADRFLRYPAQNFKFRSQLCQHFPVQFRGFYAGCGKSHGGGDHLRQRNQALIGLGPGLHIPLRPVRQFLRPMIDADGNLLPAHRTAAPELLRLGRRQTEMAFPMPVHMIFPFLGIKLNGSAQAVSRLDSLLQALPGRLPIKEGGLPSQLRRRVGVGAGYQLKIIQHGQPPVHGRIRGKPRLHRVDIQGQIPKTFFHRIKSGKGSQKGKMRRPDMGGNQHALRTGVQKDFQQIPAVQPQNRPSVRMDIPDGFQPGRQPVRLLKPRQQNHIVNLPHFAVFLVNGTDFSGDNKKGLFAPAGLPVLQPIFLFQPVQTVPGLFQLFLQFPTPVRMGKIPRSHHPDSFSLRPESQMFRVAFLAGGPGKPGMNM